MTQTSNTPPSIWIDGDACPVKDEVYKVALRYNLRVTLVANAWLRTPDHPLISFKLVSDGFDAADDYIAEAVDNRCLVVTSDILLAERCVHAGARVLAPNGKPFTENSIGGAVATRAIMADLRAGVGSDNIGGPPPFSKTDRSRFLQSLDTELNQLIRKSKRP